MWICVVTLPVFQGFLTACTLPSHFLFFLFLSSCFFLLPSFFSFVFNHVSSLLQFVYPDVFGNLWLVSQNDQFLPHLITYENQGRSQACVLFWFILSVSIISSCSAQQGRKQAKAHFCASLYLCYVSMLWMKRSKVLERVLSSFSFLLSLPNVFSWHPPIWARYYKWIYVEIHIFFANY